MGVSGSMTRMSKRAAWLAVPVIWLLASLVTSARGGMMIANGHATAMPWSELFAGALFDYSWWMVLGPATVFAVLHVVKSRLGTPARIAVLTVTCIAIVMVYFLLRASVHLPGDRMRLGFMWSSLLSTLPTSVGLYVVILTGALATLAFRNAADREREAAALILRTSRLETQLVEAQLGVLRAQLHPHFLFNSLHAISTLVDWRPKDARRMIVRLSDLLRLALTLSEEREITLARELEWLEHYLELQQLRFGDRLAVEVRIAPDTLAALVPPLILQPLVENAIKHGIEKRAEGGRVAIVAERDGKWLRVRVTDDGPGVGVTSNAPGAGVGLRNTRERLIALYGDEQQVVLRAHEPRGAEALVELPYHAQAEASPIVEHKLTG